MRDLRSLLLLAFSLAHQISEECLDLEHRLAHRRFYAEQLADAGVSILAHIACADASYPPFDAQSHVELARSLAGARERLDECRTILKRLVEHGNLPETTVEELRQRIEELMAVVRGLELEVRAARRLAG